MPEFSVKEVHLPELHLPEIKRDEIVRVLSGVHVPEVDLAKARRVSVKVPNVALTTSDLGRLLAAGAAVARFVRPAPSRRRWLPGPSAPSLRTKAARIVKPRPRRSRWPIVMLAIVIAAGAWLLLRRHATPRSLEETAQTARDSFDPQAARDSFDEMPGTDTSPEAAVDELISVNATESGPIDADLVAGSIEGPAAG